MTYLDLVNEGWVKFPFVKNLNKKIGKKEYKRIVLESYKNFAKYSKEMNPFLLERYNNLDRSKDNRFLFFTRKTDK